MSLFPTTGRLAGIDYGEKRVGISVCDPDRILTSPLENYTRRGKEVDGPYLSKLLAEERVKGLVVGLPVFASGEESPSSQAARQFGKWLGEITGLPIIYYDERYTSSEAERLLGDARMTSKQKKARRDMLAAQILLSAYLENPARAERPPEGLDDK